MKKTRSSSTAGPNLPSSAFPCFAALAIEDRLDFKFEYGDYNFEYTETISCIGNENYFHAIRRNLIDLFSTLAEDDRHGSNLLALMGSIKKFVISMPGVIEDRKTVIQLPLWNWPPTDTVISWTWDGKKSIHGFNCADVVCGAIQDAIRRTEKKGNFIVPEEWRQRLSGNVIVINDATACAAFEYHKRSLDRDAQPYDFALIKIHNGINAGIVERGESDASAPGPTSRSFYLKTSHPEVGHFYPPTHEIDAKAGFIGICPYHDGCLEGFVATHAFRQRAEAGNDATFRIWRRYLLEIRNAFADYSEDQIDVELLNRILSEDESHVGVDLISYYVAHLVHRLAIGNAIPELIVLAGRMATPAVVAAVQQKVRRWTRGYPRRRNLNEDIEKYVIETIASTAERRRSDVGGAWVIAKSEVRAPSFPLRDRLPLSADIPAFDASRAGRKGARS